MNEEKGFNVFLLVVGVVGIIVSLPLVALVIIIDAFK